MYVGPFACLRRAFCALALRQSMAMRRISSLSSVVLPSDQIAGRKPGASLCDHPFPNFVLSRPIFFHRAFPLGCVFTVEGPG